MRGGWRGGARLPARSVDAAPPEQDPIRRSGGRIVGYFLPTDYAGPTNEAYGIIEFFLTLASYEQYRRALADDPITRKMRPSSSGAAKS
jgi:hypothetical protein